MTNSPTRPNAPERDGFDRLFQGILIVSVVLGSWLGMQAVHELGHVLGAWATGGTVARVVLHPLTISRTDLDSNPRALVVVWAGPVFGVLVPLVLWGLAEGLRLRGAFVWRFFAGFCLIANGMYIAVGSFDGVGDCGEMLRHGSPPWTLWLFGGMAVPAGLWLWHRQGRHFGLGIVGKVDRGVAYVCLVGFVVQAIACFLVGGE
jgi:hypothetical protein